MSKATVSLPSFWRFAWLFFMQPITLHRLLRDLKVDPEKSLWKLLRRQRSPYEGWWLMRSLQLLLFASSGVVWAGAGFVPTLGRAVDWPPPLLLPSPLPWPLACLSSWAVASLPAWL